MARLPQAITFVKGVFGGITNLMIGMFLNNWQIQLNYFPAALLIGIFSYGISIVLYVTSAQNLGATRSQILFSTAPFWGIFGACIFLREPLTLIALISSSILVFRIVFTIYPHMDINITTKEWCIFICIVMMMVIITIFTRG